MAITQPLPRPDVAVAPVSGRWLPRRTPPLRANYPDPEPNRSSLVREAPHVRTRPGPSAANTDAAVSEPVALAVLVQAAVSSAIAAAAQVAGCGERQGREPGRTVCADMGCSSALRDRSGSAWPGLADPGLGGDLDGVPGAAQRRGVGQVQVADGVDGHAVVDRGGGNVGAIGDLGVLVAEQLHAEQPPGGPVAGDADGDAVAAGVVGLVIIGLRLGGDRVEPGR